MANAVYPSFKTALLSPGFDLSTVSIKAALVTVTSGTTNYTYSSSHANFSDVASGAILATGVALSGKAVASGALTASSVVWPTVAISGSRKGDAIILYVDTGTPSTSKLIGYIDTATGLPATPTGQDITLNWSSSVLALS